MQDIIVSLSIKYLIKIPSCVIGLLVIVSKTQFTNGGVILYPSIANITGLALPSAVHTRHIEAKTSET